MDSGQHISFYLEHTFNLIANKYNIHYIQISNEFHILRHKFEHDVSMNPSLVKELEYQEARSKFESYTMKDYYMFQQKNSMSH